MKKLGAGVLIAAFLLFSVLGCIVLDVSIYARNPGPGQTGERPIDIEPGLNVVRLSKELHRQGIIKHPAKFRLFARLKGYDKQIKTGEFLVSSAMSPVSILEKIVSGRVQLYRLTVPEGYNLQQIASLVAKAGFCDEGDFLAVAGDARLVWEEDIPAETLEGYLFPDTYYFPKGATAKSIVTTMVRGLRSGLLPEWEERAEDLGLTLHQVIILASIIEKETGAAFERPIISSVFHNRLRRRMRLESDPTVIYGIENFDGNIRRKHLKTPTPYNTYTRRGLPAGPIANPGLASIEAALYPADTELLYFVSKGDGTHQFSTNMQDHNRAVYRYQLSR